MKRYLNGRMIILAGILLLGFYFGACNVNHGLPYPYENDGLNHVQQALRYGRGTLRPFGFMHGPLIDYVLFFEYGVYFLVNLFIGRMAQPVDLLKEYILDPSMFFILGRLTVVLFSVGCLFLIYLICRRFIDEKTGLISALFTSVSFSMAYMAHSIKTDITVGFFILCSFYFALKALEYKHHFRPLYISALLIGLAITAKYYGVFGIFIIFAVLIIKIKNKEITLPIFLKLLLSCVFITASIHLILNPYLLMEFKRFIAQIFILKTGYHTVTFGLYDKPSSWQYLLFLKQAVGWPIFYLYLLSLLFIFFNRNILLCNVYPIFLYIFLSFFKRVSPWYISAIVPFVSISSAFLLMKAADFFFKKKKLHALIVFSIAVLFSLPSFITSLKYCMLLGCRDTRTLTKEWVESNIGKDSRILIESAYDFNIAAGCPPLRENVNTLKRELDEIQKKGGSGFMWEYKIKYVDIPKSPTYELYKTVTVTKEQVEKYKPEYIILDNYSEPSNLLEYDIKKGYLNLEKNYVCVKKIMPDIYIKFFPSFDSLSLGAFEVINKIDLKSLNAIYSYGPVIEIYKRGR